MAAIQIIVLCVAAALIAVTLRADRPEMAMALTMAAGILAVMLALPDLREAVAAFTEISERAGIASESVSLMLRATGIALISEFGAQLCRDADEGTLAQRIEFGGRIAILALSAPVLLQLLNRLSGVAF